MTEQEVRATIEAQGWKKDRFGNYKSTKGTVRIKMQAVSLRVERAYRPKDTWGFECPLQWLKVTSAYFKDIKTSSAGCLIVNSKVLLNQVP